MSIEQQEIVRRGEGLFGLADQLEARLSAAQRPVDALTPLAKLRQQKQGLMHDLLTSRVPVTARKENSP